MQKFEDYRFGGFGACQYTPFDKFYQLLKYMGFKEDMETIEEIKGRYYKLYFRKNKECGESGQKH